MSSKGVAIPVQTCHKFFIFNCTLVAFGFVSAQVRGDCVRRPQPPAHGGGGPGDPRTVLHPDDDDEEPASEGVPGHPVQLQPGKSTGHKEPPWIGPWHSLPAPRHAGNTSGCSFFENDHHHHHHHHLQQARSCDNKSPLSERSSGDGGSDRETCGHYATVGRCCCYCCCYWWW